MSSTRPGNRERGWNDPPEFLHDKSESVNLVTNQRTILNKRVGYNFSGNDLASAATTTANATPGVPMPIPIPPTGPSASAPVFFASSPPKTPTLATSFNNEINKSEASDIHTQAQSEQTLSVEAVEKAINDKLDYLKEKGISTKISDDISKRIKVFISSWEKLSNSVKIKMSELANALNAGEFNKADDIHVRLMMDYSSEVIQWMVGIKKLIYELKNSQS